MPPSTAEHPDLLGRFPGRVYLRPGFLGAESCAQLCEEMGAAPREAAAVLTSETVGGGGRSAWYADVSESAVRRVEARLEDERVSVSAFFGRPLGVREGPGFLCYDAGGFYGPHRDRAEDADWPDAARRRVSAVLFLNSGAKAGGPGRFVGGTLRLFLDDEAPLEIAPVGGTLVAFPSDALHEVTSVVEGVRYAVVDWYYDAAASPAAEA